MVKGVNRSYEDKVKKKYSEFNKVGIGTWNAVDFKGRWVNMYVDEELVRHLFTSKIKSSFGGVKKDLIVLDFGGGDGTLISIVKNQLGENFNVEAYNLDLNEDSLSLCSKKNPELKIIKHNLLFPYKENFANVILCRFVMQYQSKEEQLKIIKSAYSTLEENGLFFVLWPSHPNKEYLNSLESEVVHIITGKDKEISKHSRYFPSKEEMIGFLKQEGFEVVFSNDTDVKQYYTVEGWDDRFDLTDDQKSRLTKLFNKYSKKYPEAFEMAEGFQTHQGFHCLVVGKKIN